MKITLERTHQTRIEKFERTVYGDFFKTPFVPRLWVVYVDGKRYDSFHKKTNALKCIRRLKVDQQRSDAEVSS